ncbi:LITAF domain-containing protein-like [Lineus longissimus]|uniref:LITAF domain-containing protein-like n=1 Tax=Lineus longissimus TaxID=88925 RepID=UPI002B4C5159
MNRVEQDPRQGHPEGDVQSDTAAPPYQQGYPSEQLPPPPVSYQAPVVTTTTGTSFVVAAPMTVYREAPVTRTCQHCQAHVTSAVSYTNGMMVWVICGVLAFVGLWIGCCLIPFCLNSCKNVVHTCPNCHQIMGIYDRLNG